MKKPMPPPLVQITPSPTPIRTLQSYQTSTGLQPYNTLMHASLPQHSNSYQTLTEQPYSSQYSLNNQQFPQYQTPYVPLPHQQLPTPQQYTQQPNPKSSHRERLFTAIKQAILSTPVHLPLLPTNFRTAQWLYQTYTSTSLQTTTTS